MTSKTVGAAEFKATCLRIIEQMQDDRQPVIVTRRGRPVALLSPLPQEHSGKSFIGALKGTVLRYGDPFAPATDPADWDAMR